MHLVFQCVTFAVNYRSDYQGIVPPVKRSEEDFDAGAKYHVPGT